MSMSLSSSQSFLPNLPGFKARDVSKSGAKKQFFTYTNGSPCMKGADIGPPSPDGPRGLDDLSTTLSLKSSGVLSRQGSNVWLKDGDYGVVLTFQAYFEEPDGTGEYDLRRVRKCNISFYVEDGSLSVIERPQMNSGIPQGTLVKRSIALRPDGEPFSVNDFKLGDELSIFGRKYRLVDCDHATRKYLRRVINTQEAPSLDTPTDPYEEERMKTNSTVMTTWSQFRSKKNANKTFLEAKLGNTVNNEGRQGFITFGQKQLKFLCIWDNTQSLYGDLIEFSLSYNLSDDTVEIFSVPTASGTREQFSRLLKRSKLPKLIGTNILTGGDPVDSLYYTWKDFYLGLDLSVYGRTLTLIDADSQTRDFYREIADLELGPSLRAPPQETIEFERESVIEGGSTIGLESEEPKRKNGEMKDLTFIASLLSGGPDDVARRFVVTFHCNDATVKIIEPPLRNSGFIGGTFLSRRKVKRETGEPLVETDFFIGAKLRIYKHIFYLMDANESTLKWMENNYHLTVRADFYNALSKLRPYLGRDAESGELARKFESLQSPDDIPGAVTKAMLEEILQSYGLFSNEDESRVCEHEIITLVRKTKKLGKGFYEIISEIIEPTYIFRH